MKILNQKIVLIFVLSTLWATAIFAQMDSTLIFGIRDFVSGVFGPTAGETTANILFRVFGMIISFEVVILFLLRAIPTDSPVKGFILRLINSLLGLVKDKNKAGGYF